MANEIKDKFGSATALTITVASLADGNGWQSTIVDNTSLRYQDAILSVKIKTQAGAGGDSVVGVYLIRDDNDGTPNRTDSAAASDAALTIVNAGLIGVVKIRSAGGVQTEEADFLVHRLGPKWGIAIKNETGATLDTTGGNHRVGYVGLNPEVQ